MCGAKGLFNKHFMTSLELHLSRPSRAKAGNKVLVGFSFCIQVLTTYTHVWKFNSFIFVFPDKRSIKLMINRCIALAPSILWLDRYCFALLKWFHRRLESNLFYRRVLLLADNFDPRALNLKFYAVYHPHSGSR